MITSSRALTVANGMAPSLDDGAWAPYFGDDGQAMAFVEHAKAIDVDTVMSNLLGGTPTRAGVPMSAAQAMRVGVVFACVRVIAEDIGKLPLHFLRRTEVDGRRKTTRASDHPLHDVLTRRPNDWMTRQELLEYMVGTAALHGAAYAWLNRGPSGTVEEILPLLPGRVRRVADGWNVYYEITGYGEQFRFAQPSDIWCLNGFMNDPLRGWDISEQAREAVALAAAMEQSQSRFHASDHRPSGILTTKQIVKPEVRDNIRDQWRAAYGPGGQGGVAVLDSEFDFKAVTTSATDGQVIENRTFQIEDICRFMRVHPWAIMRQSSSQSYASLEQTALAHIQHTMMPWAVRVEETMRRDVIGDDEPELYLKINLDALARTTLADRMNAYDKMVKIYATPNYIRELEDLDPIDDPAMDRVQLMANNTGIKPTDTARPAATPSTTPSPPTRQQPAAEAAQQETANVDA